MVPNFHMELGGVLILFQRKLCENLQTKKSKTIPPFQHQGDSIKYITYVAWKFQTLGFLRINTHCIVWEE